MRCGSTCEIEDIVCCFEGAGYTIVFGATSLWGELLPETTANIGLGASGVLGIGFVVFKGSSFLGGSASAGSSFISTGFTK
jgi:hypothetical protein